VPFDAPSDSPTRVSGRSGGRDAGRRQWQLAALAPRYRSVRVRPQDLAGLRGAGDRGRRGQFGQFEGRWPSRQRLVRCRLYRSGEQCEPQKQETRLQIVLLVGLRSARRPHRAGREGVLDRSAAGESVLAEPRSRSLVRVDRSPPAQPIDTQSRTSAGQQAAGGSPVRGKNGENLRELGPRSVRSCYRNGVERTQGRKWHRHAAAFDRRCRPP